MVYHLIEFTTAKFDVSKETPNPTNPLAGQGVLKWLREKLAERGYHATEPRTEDWGWYIYVDFAGASYIVGASGDGDSKTAEMDWMVSIETNRSLMDRLCGRNKLVADDPLVALIERTIRGEPSIRVIASDGETL